MNVRAKNNMPIDTMPHITSAVQPAKNSFRLSAMLTIMGFNGKRVKWQLTFSFCFTKIPDEVGKMQTFNLWSRASATETAAGNSGVIEWSTLESGIAVDINVSAMTGTNPTITFYVERTGLDGVYYAIYTSAAITAASTVSLNIGPKLNTSRLIGTSGRLRWVIGGTDTPTVTFSASITGK